jgi:hypothetical protein
MLARTAVSGVGFILGVFGGGVVHACKQASARACVYTCVCGHVWTRKEPTHALHACSAHGCCACQCVHTCALCLCTCMCFCMRVQRMHTCQHMLPLHSMSGRHVCGCACCTCACVYLWARFCAGVWPHACWPAHTACVCPRSARKGLKIISVRAFMGGIVVCCAP